MSFASCGANAGPVIPLLFKYLAIMFGLTFM